MAYSTTYGLIYFTSGTAEKLPLKYIRFDTYKVTPNQRTDLDSSVNTNGKLVRHVLKHTRSKVEFTIPMMDSETKSEFLAILNRHYSSTLERKIAIKYWDDDTETYKTGTFYIPDISWQIRNIAENEGIGTGNIVYNETRIAFIEY